MMRSNPSSSMQKTYDECFLTCSTAVYFESQNNEAEALRSWRNALDQIYYHNAYRVPAAYRPKSETERALQDSLHQLELQCKERVDLLEALKRSREEAKNALGTLGSGTNGSPAVSNPFTDTTDSGTEPGRIGWLGGGTVPPVDYPDLSRPPLPQRPALQPRKSSGTDTQRNRSLPLANDGASLPILSPGLTVPPSKTSRTPSPDKKGGMLRTLRPGGKDGTRPSSSKMLSSLRNRPPAAAKAATQAWGSSSKATTGRPIYSQSQPSRESVGDSISRSSLERPVSRDDAADRPISRTFINNPDISPSPFYFRYSESADTPAGAARPNSFYAVPPPKSSTTAAAAPISRKTQRDGPPTPPPHKHFTKSLPNRTKITRNAPTVDSNVLAYRNAYPNPEVNPRKIASAAAPRVRSGRSTNVSPALVQEELSTGSSPPNLRRIALPKSDSYQNDKLASPSGSGDEDQNSGIENGPLRPRRQGKEQANTIRADLPPTPNSQDPDVNTSDSALESRQWKEKVDRMMKCLPAGVDEAAAKQIINEIVIQGDEVHWDDVAGLEIAKSALKETVVYPFLRPDLFMGLREPARGMLLFGPPGTGKTMLARAVATESKSTFFAISASSLTSKFLGESEKLVRALFGLAKALAPSIIFVDEIDSLLSSRSSSGEHEATRRIKTEFLIQWSDLAKAAAGREQSDRDRERGDASRVLVLAATNLPWAIDEAARRRFVRRQYIPLPEDHVRELQLRTLLSHQKHSLKDEDLDRLVELTDGFSGSDITALAKDAAMGPLRSLGERLLHMTMDEIRPIQFQDFRASLSTIRPSVSKQGLKEFEGWAREFGERGG